VKFILNIDRPNVTFDAHRNLRSRGKAQQAMRDPCDMSSMAAKTAKMIIPVLKKISTPVLKGIRPAGYTPTAK
jgi:hypothetical protein